MEREDIVRSCQNCDFEYYCSHHVDSSCKRWRADLNCRQMIEHEGDKCANKECVYHTEHEECPAAEGCAGFTQEVAYG